MKLGSVCLAAVLLIAAGPVTAADNSLARIVDSHALTVGVAQNAPWIIKKPDGSWTGYDIDLAKALARDLNVTPRFVEVPFAELLPRLTKGEFDFVTSGIAITSQRSLSVVFSNPTGLSAIRTVTHVTDDKASQPSPIVAGTKIAVLNASTDEAAAKANYPQAIVVAFPSSGAALAALIGGETQAMVAISPVPRMAIRLYDRGLVLVGKPLTRTAEAFALRPDDDRLRLYLNNWIDARKADGFLDNARRYWFFDFAWLNDLNPSQRPASPAK